MRENRPDLQDLRDAWEMAWSQLAAQRREGELPTPNPPEGPDPYGNPDPAWMKIDWRRYLRRVEVGDTTVNYVDAGPLEGQRGLDLVLVHGLAGCWQNWLETIPALARRHRVIAMDLPGFGHSAMPPWEISIPAYGRLLNEFSEAVGVAEAAIAGNSVGGYIAAEAVAADPERFDKLALVSVAGTGRRRKRRARAEFAGRLAVALAPVALSFQSQTIRRTRLRRALFGSVLCRPEELRRELLYEQYRNGANRPGFLPALTSLTAYDFLGRIEGIAKPTLIVWGRNDRIVPPEDGLGYAQLLPGAQTVVMDGTGHCPMLERPVRFNRLLEAFLDS
ncbi:MAG TPA: alpha/beta hydrolase [Solirubrobacterales bacterium]